MPDMTEPFPNSLHDRLLVMEAVFWLLLAKVLVRFVPFRRWVWVLGTKGKSTPDDALMPELETQVGRISSSLSVGSARLPGGHQRFNCLIQAIAGQWMLRRRSIPCTLHIGVGRTDKPEGAFHIIAHAWLRSGNIFVSGGVPNRKFLHEIGQFGSDA